jgi:hypothetical protein
MDELPSYNNARGIASSLQLVPPFLFKDVTMSVFPLRANLPRLRSFCDAYLNRARKLVSFEPFLPYVYLIVLDYGKMATEVANMGWVSQIEVAFSVPLKWMVVRNGVPTFHDWAVNCPFIFVDNELSMTTGREVFGWPKMLTRLDPKSGEWLTDPHGTRNEFQVSTKTFAQTFHGDRAEVRPLLTLRHRQVPNFLDAPADLRGLFEPLASAPRLAQSMLRLGLDLFQAMRGVELKDALRLRGAAQAGLGDLPVSILRQAYVNTINLKQFRDASSPRTACYQSITNTKMGMESINRGGLLGQQNLAFGQLDGGYTIELHRHASLPIVDALGLEVAESHMDGDVAVASLSPMTPFWLKLDMNYGRGKVLAWQSRSSWQPGEELAPKDSNQRTTAQQAALAPDDTDVDDGLSALPIGNLFNTARGAAAEAVSGPFALPNTTIRVLPLLADPDRLKRFAKCYLDVQGQAHFEAWGSFVYLIAFSYSERSSEVNNVGTFAGRELNFAVPVKWYDWYEAGAYDLSKREELERRDREKLVGVALVNAFSFVDDAMVAVTSSEINGVPTLSSDIQSPPSLWMEDAGPAEHKGESLLGISSLVLPAIGVGARGGREVLLKVSTSALLAPEDEAGWREVAQNWGPHLVGDLQRKREQRGRRNEQWSEGRGWRPGGARASSFDRVRALALAMMSGELPLSSLALKQFRDASQTDRACYQSVVLGRQRIKRLYEVHEIEKPTHVLITRFPTQPVKDLLGLRVKRRQFGKEGMVEAFEAIRPFWLRADLSEELGQSLYERAGPTDWTVRHRPEQIAGWRTLPSAADLAGVASDSAESPALVTYRQRIEGRFKPVDKPLEAGDHERLVELQRRGDLRDLMLKARHDERQVLAGTRVLNHIDRVHVPDLAAFVKAEKDWPEEDKDANQTFEKAIQDLVVCDLAEDLGRIDPATVLDSILSRQWARPLPRGLYAKADFLLNVETLGPVLRDRLFPEDERQGGLWPQSRDCRQALEQELEGLAWQLWDQVWKLVEEGGSTSQDYRDRALARLPPFFHRTPDAPTIPGDWKPEQWKAVAEGLAGLISESSKVDWPRVIRPLKEWQRIAQRMAARENWDGKAAQMFSKRLHRAARSLSEY